MERQPFIKHLFKAIKEREINPVDPNEPSEVDWSNPEGDFGQASKPKPIEKLKPKVPGGKNLDLSA